MPILLGAVADDYTGASDLANTFSKNGLRTVQTIGVPPDDLKLPEVDAVVVSLKSRSIEQMKVPFAAVSVDVASGKAVVFRRGPIARAPLHQHRRPHQA